MQYFTGQMFGVSELGGPHNNWEYIQAHIEVLQNFDSEEQARAFIAADVFVPGGESMECQFIRWLAQRDVVAFRDPPLEAWNVSATLNAVTAKSPMAAPMAKSAAL